MNGMKKRILVCAASGAILYGTTRPAYALLGVGDVVFDPTNYAQLITVAQNGLNQVEQLGKIYTTATNTYQQLTNLYNSFAHITNIGQLVAALNQAGLNVPMLNQAVQLENAFRGLGLQTNLAGQIQTIVNQLQLYTPQGQDFLARQINNQSLAVAGQTAAAQMSYDASVTRANDINQLKAQLNSNDPKVSMDLAARGSLETAQAVATTNQILSAQMMQQSQMQEANMQIEQASRASTDALAAAAQNAVNANDVALVH